MSADTWIHLPDALVEDFVEGRLSDLDAVRVATHADDCAMCRNRLAAAEPLTSLFASCDEPDVPADLAARVIAALDAPPPAERPVAPGIAAGLAVAAIAVLVLLGSPGELVAGGQIVWQALGSTLRAVELPVALVTPVWMAAAMATFAAAAVTARRLEGGPRQASWR
ncbi:MAG: hypothetical protein H6742_06005 [Alphaproteobacteria bacterium]|nr:hypothetical protein [Alphaproteobacteria bacterium]